MGLKQALNVADGLWQSSAQSVSFYSIDNAFFMYFTYLPSIIDELGVSSLTARDSLLGGIQGPLPKNQWQLEVQYWHSIIMALLQRLVVEQATGPASETVYPWLVRPQTKEEQAQCHNQVGAVVLVLRTLLTFLTRKSSIPLTLISAFLASASS